jgi:hypothetical protein
MRNINAQELAILATHYASIGDIKKAKEYTDEFEQLQIEHNRD